MVVYLFDSRLQEPPGLVLLLPGPYVRATGAPLVDVELLEDVEVVEETAGDLLHIRLLLPPTLSPKELERSSGYSASIRPLKMAELPNLSLTPNRLKTPINCGASAPD